MSEGGDPILKEHKVADIGAPSPAFQVIGFAKASPNEAAPVTLTVDNEHPSFSGGRLHYPGTRQRK